MKKIICSIVTLLFGLKSYAATLEALFFYYRPNSSVLREIFSDWIPCGELRVYQEVAPWLDLFVNVDFIYSRGASLGEGHATSIRMIPISFGADIIYSWCDCADLYVGLGPKVYHLVVKNHSDEVKAKISRVDVGGMFRFGNRFHFEHGVLIDLFFDYSFCELHFAKKPQGGRNRRHNLDLSGFDLGFGIGFEF